MMLKAIKDDVYNKLKDYPYRLSHVISVALTAATIALKHNLNTKDAFISGLIHDYAKYDTNYTISNYLSKDDIIKYVDNDVNYHAIIAANYFKDKYNINNDIYLAVRNHVFGRPNMEIIEQILFISDSIYLNCKDNSRYIYTKALSNLDEATLLAITMNINHLKTKGLLPSVYQTKTYEYYLKISKEREI